MNRLLTLILAGAMLSCGADGRAAEPKAKRPDAPQAHIRIWKAEPGPGTGVRVALIDVGTGKKKPHDLATLGPGYQFESYIDVSAGKYLVDAFKTTDNGKVVDAFEAKLEPGEFATLLLIAGDAGAMSVELIPDRKVANPAPDAAVLFTIRGFDKDLRNVRVTVGDDLSVRFATGVAFLRTGGLPRTAADIRIVGTASKGVPFEWTTEADFSKNRRQTLLIYPDAYGRIRPRLTIDGEASEGAPASVDANSQS